MWMDGRIGWDWMGLDGIGWDWMGWFSKVVGSLRAPSVLIIELGVDKDAQRSSDNCHNGIAVQHFVRLYLTDGS